MIGRFIDLFKFKKAKPVLPVSLSETLSFHSSPVSPNPTIKAEVYNQAGKWVANVVYGQSPLFDVVYIYNINVYEDYERKGYGYSVVNHLAEQYECPVTPIKELESSWGFWDKVRNRNASVTAELSLYDMEQEALRWQHLDPEKEALTNLINKRIMDEGEPYDEAVSRGLPSWGSFSS